jgi:hypothetical protein
MDMRVRAAAAAAFVLAVCVADTARGAGGGEKPLPVERTAILPSENVTYTVEGRVRIGKSTVLKIQKDTKIVGKGQGGGTIELEGQLWICGVTDSKVTLQDVTIEVQPKFDTLHTDMVIFAGTSAGVVSPKDVPVDGRIFVENTDFGLAATVDVAMINNNIDVQRCTCACPVRVKAVDPPGSTGNKVRLMVMNNGEGKPGGRLSGGLVVEHVADVTVRTNIIAGGKTSFVDCGAVAFDTNYVQCKELEFVQSAAGRFGKTWMSKCDVQCGKITLTAPLDAKHPDKMPCDKCWFGGETKEKTVRDKYFVDHEKNPDSGVSVDITKIMEKPLQLAGTVTR